MSFYTLGLVLKGREDVLRALSYNGPIAFLFLVLAADLVLLLMSRQSVSGDAGTLILWGVAAVLLFLRLGAKSIEASGHMVWLPLLTTQAWLYRFPRWFILLGIVSTLWALGLKLLVFRGPSGVPGTILGLALAAALVAVHGGGRHRSDQG